MVALIHRNSTGNGQREKEGKHETKASGFAELTEKLHTNHR